MNWTTARSWRSGLPLAIVAGLVVLATSCILSRQESWVRVVRTAIRSYDQWLPSPSAARHDEPEIAIVPYQHGIGSMIAVLGLFAAFLIQGLLWSTIARRSRKFPDSEVPSGGGWLRSLNTLRAYVADEEIEGAS